MAEGALEFYLLLGLDFLFLDVLFEALVLGGVGALHLQLLLELAGAAADVGSAEIGAAAAV